ncbi:MAG: molybdenum cofactor guanylyltransferase [Methylomonas sp.]|nr:MAG: molybdenum cofactor guanylyltransferase [Methylomonas sp.]PPD26194.1 MAG: molybdenum cofactor guanylyltransferase [Methylomonas sp.]PPD37911.1 MAG: molybdenum cofactor guanylyltransferase [Methylomonas sp.]PPD42085.1 MAG: molybdenum cofactor guanylyltransferase [Methylomonas sp.]PPD53649.1 MAG: molybdenum cofactor guanylyltransferase [Methylomonas sp.]
MIERNKVSGVVLAGGRGRRMDGADKGLVMLNGRPLVRYAIDALVPLVDELFISANRNRLDYQGFGYPVIDDGNDDFDGPLAGILAALQMTQAEYLLVVPCDSPLLTKVHLQRLLNVLDEQNTIAVAFDGERLHPVILALKTGIKDDLAAYLASGERKLQRWIERHAFIRVDFSDVAPAFTNINSAAELAALEQ